jgi:hypothetical protein
MQRILITLILTLQTLRLPWIIRYFTTHCVPHSTPPVSATKSNQLTLNRKVIAIRSGNRINYARKLSLCGKNWNFLDC